MGMVDFIVFVAVEVVIVCLGTGILSTVSDKNRNDYRRQHKNRKFAE